MCPPSYYEFDNGVTVIYALGHMMLRLHISDTNEQKKA